MLFCSFCIGVGVGVYVTYVHVYASIKLGNSFFLLALSSFHFFFGGRGLVRDGFCIFGEERVEGMGNTYMICKSFDSRVGIGFGLG